MTYSGRQGKRSYRSRRKKAEGRRILSAVLEGAAVSLLGAALGVLLLFGICNDCTDTGPDEWNRQRMDRQQAQEAREEYLRQEQMEVPESTDLAIEGDVAQQDTGSELTEIELLTRCVQAEACNQGFDGRRMVADVVLNRVSDPDFPDTIREVILQDGQFQVVSNGRIYDADPDDETLEAVRMELQGVSWPGLFYFRTGRYSDYGTPWKKVGDHYFSTK